MQVLGIDIGGTGIKGAIVDVTKGTLVTERFRMLTPQPSRPNKVAATVAGVADHFGWHGLIGCTFPAIVREGVVCTAANVDKTWIGRDGQALLSLRTGSRVILLNDADAAGIAEMEFGAGRGEKGLVMMLTFGTGIGSAMFINGILMPNAELGHLKMHGEDVERRASDRARQEENLPWKKWCKRVDAYLAYLEALFSPDLFIIGGGISKEAPKFLPHLKRQTRIVPAHFFNEAGIMGAALAAHQRTRPERRGRGTKST